MNETGRFLHLVAAVLALLACAPLDGKERPYFQQMFWAGLITGPLLPSTVFPTGLSRDGLPIGVQAVGSAYNDYLTIDFARLMARELGGFQAPPELG